MLNTMVKQKHGNKKTNQKSGDFFMLVQKLHFILIDNPIWYFKIIRVRKQNDKMGTALLRNKRFALNLML